MCKVIIKCSLSRVSESHLKCNALLSLFHNIGAIAADILGTDTSVPYSFSRLNLTNVHV